MDRKGPPTSKNAGGRRGATPARAGASRLVHVILGLVLIAAGSLKLYQFAFESQDESYGTLLSMAFAEAELLGGVWLSAGLNPTRTHLYALAAFAGMSIASLTRGVAGKCSCGCLGGLAINPWTVLVFDIAALGALLAWHPPADPEATSPTQPFRLFLLILVAMIVSIGGWRQPDLITVAGTATRDGRPLGEVTLTFTGESGKLIVRTHNDGRFRLPLIRSGRYAVSLSGAPESPTSKAGDSVRRLNKKAAKPSGRKPATVMAKVGQTLSWVDAPGCSEEDKIVEFR